MHAFIICLDAQLMIQHFINVFFQAVEEDSQSEDDEESLLITEYPLTRALGLERPGCVRGRGFGVTLKTLEAQGINMAWRKNMEDQLQELKECTRQMQDLRPSSSINPNKVKF